MPSAVHICESSTAYLSTSFWRARDSDPPFSRPETASLQPIIMNIFAICQTQIVNSTEPQRTRIEWHPHLDGAEHHRVQANNLLFMLNINSVLKITSVTASPSTGSNPLTCSARRCRG